MTDEEKIKNRKLALLALLALVVIILAVWLISTLMTPAAPKIDYGPGVEIVDLKKQIPEISDDFANNLKADLFSMLNKNSSSTVNNETTKATIRSGSVTSEKDDNENSRYYSFIIDVDSLRQSYRVQMNWSYDKDGNAIPYGGYPTIISCLFDTDEAIYGDFKCVDDFTDAEEIYE